LNFFNSEQASNLLKCSVRTVEDLARTGRLYGNKFGDSWIFPEKLFFESIELPRKTSASTFTSFTFHPPRTMSLTLEQAQTIINIALEKSRKHNFDPMAIVVLDASGSLKTFASEDGASMFCFDTARAKAMAAFSMGVSSYSLGERAKKNPHLIASLTATSAGKFLPQKGAVVIRDASRKLIGAVGASGGNGHQDELICVAGVAAAGLLHC
jgi:uncharacterized protein GlcG (DUF336 family)